MNFVPGIVLILNNRNNRPGTDCDVNKLKITLENLNATVKVVHFGDDEESSIERSVKNFIDPTDFSQYLWVTIAIFSHGTGDEQIQILEGRDCIVVQDTLLNPLLQIPALEGKLKWLIIQACRGELDVHSGTPDGPQARARLKYYIKSFSSQEGCISYRRAINDQPQGSIYIHYLCENLNRYADTKDIFTILNATIESVQNYYEENNFAGLTQEPRNDTNLQKSKFFFTSGIMKPAMDTMDKNGA